MNKNYMALCFFSNPWYQYRFKRTAEIGVFSVPESIDFLEHLAWAEQAITEATHVQI